VRLTESLLNKKYVLWNTGICPIAVIVRNTFDFDDDIKTHNKYHEYLWVNGSTCKSLSSSKRHLKQTCLDSTGLAIINYILTL